jgi:hypothetical protein
MRLSDLMAASVVDEDGNALGHVHDVRARVLQRRNPDGRQLRIVGLVIGGRGIRERLRLDATGHAPKTSGDVVEWERVIDVDAEAGTITVRPG